LKRTPPEGAPMPLRLAATFFLVGEAAPFAPATFASLFTLPFLWFFLDAAGWLQVVLTLVVTWVAILVSDRAETYYGHDAKPITIDEVAGMMVTFITVPAGDSVGDRCLVLLAGFVLFRVMDVIKPFPAGRAQNLPGGRGVVMDDFLAGIYANLALRILLRFV
jgi:phosphatidylglycerophosphatase A